jgi:hypothetical protein
MRLFSLLMRTAGPEMFSKRASAYPKLIGIVGIDGDRRWDIFELVVHQG